MADSELFSQFKNLAVEANFMDSTELLQSLNINKPDASFVMHNSYAFLVSSELPHNLEEEIAIKYIIETTQQLTEWIRNILLLLENTKGLLVDGYLVILLRNPPSSKTTETIRKIESDTRACRKHIVWPDYDASNTSLKIVTALGLPESPSTMGQIRRDFEMSAEVQFILDRYQELKSLEKLVEIIKNPENVD